MAQYSYLVGFTPDPGTDPNEGVGVFQYSDGKTRRAAHPDAARVLMSRRGNVPDQNADPLSLGVPAAAEPGGAPSAAPDAGSSPGGLSGLAPNPTMGTPAASLAPPARVGGMPASGAQLSGVPLSAEQLTARLEEADRDAARVEETTRAAGEGARVAARTMADELNRQASERLSNADVELRRQEEIAAEADRRVSAELAQEVGKIDPGRFIKSRTTGQTIAGGIAILLGGIGGSRPNGNGRNVAVDTIEKAIDDDIRSQADELGAKRAQSNNRVRYWSEKFGSAERGIAAAKIEAQEAVKLRLQALAGTAKSEEARLETEKAIALMQQSQHEAKNKLVDGERERLKTLYEPPKPVAPAAPVLPPIPAGASSMVKQPGEVRDAYAAQFARLPIKERDAVLSNVRADMAHIGELERAVNELGQIYGRGGGGGAQGFPRWVFTTADDRRAKQLWAVVETQTRAGWKSEPNGAETQARLSQISIPTRDSDVPMALQHLRESTAEARRLIEAGHAPEAMAYYYSQAPSPVAKPVDPKTKVGIKPPKGGW